MSMYLNSTKTLNELFTLTKTPEGTVSPATVTSSDEEIAKWVLNDEGTDSVFTALKEGKAKKPGISMCSAHIVLHQGGISLCPFAINKKHKRLGYAMVIQPLV